ncbi:O-antigen ligase family protein [Solimonas flava]|uniref:O-antigen ligase family protein n=1 Tax=Solimonas flava TaxID=415849 RepID=UPI00040337A3|nr:O-antigen ligase family protein [Solimonas flava]
MLATVGKEPPQWGGSFFVAMQTLTIFLLAAGAAWAISGWEPIEFLQTRYDEVRIAQFALFALLIPLFAKFGAPLPRGSRAAFLALLTIGVVSASFAEFPTYGFVELGLMSALVCAGLAAREWTATHSNLRPLIILVTSAGALVLGTRLLIDFIAAFATSDARGLVSAWLPFTTPRFFAKAATWALPLLWCAPLLLDRHRTITRFCCAAAAVAMSAQVIGTGSRGAVVGIGMAMLACLFLGQTGRSYARWQVLIGLLGFLLWRVVETSFGLATSRRLAMTALNGRAQLNAAAWADVQSSPWIGIGPMQYSAVDRHPTVLGAGTHDFALQFAAEWGIPAAMMLFALGAWWFWATAQSIRLRNAAGQPTEKRDAAIDTAIFAGATAALVHGLVANVFNDPVSQLIAVLLIGISIPSRRNAVELTKGRSRLLRSVLAVFCLAASGMAISLGRTCIQPDSVQLPRGSTVFPRLWSQGLIPYSKTCRMPPEGSISALPPGEYIDPRLNPPQ